MLVFELQDGVLQQNRTVEPDTHQRKDQSTVRPGSRRPDPKCGTERSNTGSRMVHHQSMSSHDEQQYVSLFLHVRVGLVSPSSKSDWQWLNRIWTRPESDPKIALVFPVTTWTRNTFTIIRGLTHHYCSSTVNISVFSLTVKVQMFGLIPVLLWQLEVAYVNVEVI